MEGSWIEFGCPIKTLTLLGALTGNSCKPDGWLNSMRDKAKKLRKLYSHAFILVGFPNHSQKEIKQKKGTWGRPNVESSLSCQDSTSILGYQSDLKACELSPMKPCCSQLKLSVGKTPHCLLIYFSSCKLADKRRWWGWDFRLLTNTEALTVRKYDWFYH